MGGILTMKLVTDISIWLFLLMGQFCFPFSCGFVPSNSRKLTGTLQLLKDSPDSEPCQEVTPLSQPPVFVSRVSFLQYGLAAVVGTAVGTISNYPMPSWAFEGGVGGLGKTKPSTGVELFDEESTPIQNAQGIIQAEITSATGKPVLVQFQAPWQLLSTAAGLEARDLRTSESAFIQVISLPKNNNNWRDRKVFTQLLTDTVLGSQGKFGAYGTPVDVKVKPLKKKKETVDDDDITYSVTFTSYTPSMIESERTLWIKPKQVEESTLVMLITGTTSLRFASQEAVFRKILDSFQVTIAPESRLRKDFTGLVKERQL